MARHINKCTTCSAYTMEEQTCKCGGTVITSKPPKYSPEDKYARYRRDAKKEDLKTKGLL